MKISVFAIPDIPAGKHNIKDARLDQLNQLVPAKKKTYVQIDIVGEEGMLEADAILVPIDSRADLILKDLEFIETRSSRATDEQEKALLDKIKTALEKEQFVLEIGLTPEEQQSISAYGLCTVKPVIVAQKSQLEDTDALLAMALAQSGFISFFTAGEKETRAWLIKKGTSAWGAAGAVHTDIQRGFIRAEVISFDDYIQAGGENAAKQQGKMRLEPKEYVMQDADIANFRFNK
jgi:hypothetical protein